MSLHPLRNPIQEYAWGSHTALAELLGLPFPTEAPWAELWIGAHPSAPSQVLWREAWQSLDAVIADRPQAVLGASAGPEGLPFLFKVLAVEHPLSLQAHPDAEKARVGFDREERAGLPWDSPRRCYRDPFAKPEMLCALTPFEALCGFRELSAVFDLAAGLACPELDAALAEAAPDTPGGLLCWLLELPRQRQQELAHAAATVAERRGDTDGPHALLRSLAAAYPGDAGVLAPLLLNHLSLAPGDALYLDPGRIHSYLSGVGVELMGNSDNVVRGGLTAKHIDPWELDRVLCRDPWRPRVLRPTERDGIRRYAPASAPFELAVYAPRPRAPVTLERDARAAILFCSEGEPVIHGDGETPLPLARGEALLVTADSPALRLEGAGVVHCALPAGRPSR